MSWLSGYSYRKSFTLSRASGAISSNYPIRMTINRTSGTDSGNSVFIGTKCLATYADIRFTKSDGTSLLDYYVEPDYTSSLATVWVEYDSIGTGATTFYMYYGKAGGTSASSGPNTFIYYQGFDGLNNGTLNAQDSWTVSGGSGCTVGSTDYGKGAYFTYSTAAVDAYRGVSLSSINVQFEYWWKSTDVGQNNELQMYIIQNGTVCSGFNISASKGYHQVNGGAWTQFVTGLTSNVWRKYAIGVTAAGTHDVLVDQAVVTSGNNNSNMTTTNPRAHMATNGYSLGVGYYAWVDEIKVGQYLNPGPAWGSWGAEESAPATFVPRIIIF